MKQDMELSEMKIPGPPIGEVSARPDGPGLAVKDCLRCGRCCVEVGRTFWKGGNEQCDGRPFGDNEGLNRLAGNGDHEDGGLPCEMLEVVDGLAVCKIERDYGRQYKPITCIEYPVEGELCFAENSVSSVCSVAKN